MFKTPSASWRMPLPAGAVLHLIGQLQSNKAKPAVALFDIIESVDRISLIDALEKEAERRGEPVSVLFQVNIAREPQKAGCAPESASAIDGAPGSLALAAAPRADDYGAPGRRCRGDPAGIFGAARIARRLATRATRGRSRHPLDGDERRLSRGHRGGRHLGSHRARDLSRASADGTPVSLRHQLQDEPDAGRIGGVLPAACRIAPDCPSTPISLSFRRSRRWRQSTRSPARHHIRSGSARRMSTGLPTAPTRVRSRWACCSLSMSIWSCWDMPSDVATSTRPTSSSIAKCWRHSALACGFFSPWARQPRSESFGVSGETVLRQLRIGLHGVAPEHLETDSDRL